MTVVTNNACNFDTGTSTTVLHGNVVGSGSPFFNAVLLTADVSGTLPIGNGGTNTSSQTANGVIFCNSGGTALVTNAALTFNSTSDLLQISTAVATPQISVITTLTGSSNSSSLLLQRGDQANGGTFIFHNTGATTEWKNGTFSGSPDYVFNSPALGSGTLGNALALNQISGLATFQGTGSPSNAVSSLAFFSSVSTVGGNIYSISVFKQTVDGIMIGVNKNTLTGSVPINGCFISTYGSTSTLSLGRGNGANLPNTADLFISSVGGAGVVSIGTTSPTADKLNINGSIVLNQAIGWTGVLSAVPTVGTYIAASGSQTIGFYTNSALRMSLNSTGVLNLTSLTASQVVVTDASHNLSTTGTLSTSLGGTGTSTTFTQGSVVFAGASGVYSQNNSNFFWNNTGGPSSTGSLSLGTTSSSYVLNVVSSTASTTALFQSSTSSALTTMVDMLQPNATSGTTNVFMRIGTQIGTRGYGTIGFSYTGSLSSTNGLMLGTASNSNLVLINEGAVNIHAALNMGVGNILAIIAGTNGRAGTATLVAGSVTVANTTITSVDLIFLSRVSLGGTIGNLTYTLSAGTSFTIHSSSSTDTSVVAYLIIASA